MPGANTTPTPGVIYDFCTGRGAKYPVAFLDGWAARSPATTTRATTPCSRREGRTEAGCLAHARRKFDELAKANASPVALQAIQRIARLYRVEQDRPAR